MTLPIPSHGIAAFIGKSAAETYYLISIGALEGVKEAVPPHHCRIKAGAASPIHRRRRTGRTEELKGFAGQRRHPAPQRSAQNWVTQKAPPAPGKETPAAATQRRIAKMSISSNCRRRQRVPASLTGRDGYLVLQALAYAITTIEALPEDWQERSNAEQMKQLLDSWGRSNPYDTSRMLSATSSGRAQPLPGPGRWSDNVLSLRH